MKSIKAFAVASAVVVAMAAPAFAQSSGGVKVGGDVKMNTAVGTAVNAAIGEGNTAKQQIGGVQGNVQIGGDLKQNTAVGTAVNAAIGKGNKACQNIGGISSDASCK